MVEVMCSGKGDEVTFLVVEEMCNSTVEEVIS